MFEKFAKDFIHKYLSQYNKNINNYRYNQN